jgi:predicted nucleotidyltransferase
VFYRPADDCPILEELTSIIVKTVGVRERMRKALAPLEEKIHCAAIFGSWARGDQQPDSDIDLLIIGSVSLREVSKALRGPAAELGREVSPVVMSHRELRDRLDEGDHFATRLAESEMIRIIGDTDDFGDLAR